MLVKIVSLFLIFMVVLAMFGRLRLPGAKHLEAAKCAKCGRFKFKPGPCDCEGRNG